MPSEIYHFLGFLWCCRRTLHSPNIGNLHRCVWRGRWQVTWPWNTSYASQATVGALAIRRRPLLHSRSRASRESPLISLLSLSNGSFSSKDKLDSGSSSSSPSNGCFCSGRSDVKVRRALPTQLGFRSLPLPRRDSKAQTGSLLRYYSVCIPSTLPSFSTF